MGAQAYEAQGRYTEMLTCFVRALARTCRTAREFGDPEIPLSLDAAKMAFEGRAVAERMSQSLSNDISQRCQRYNLPLPPELQLASETPQQLRARGVRCLQA